VKTPAGFGDWEVVERKTNGPIRYLTGILLHIILVSEPAAYSSVTWTLRHYRTGRIRKITAMSEAEVSERISKGELA
jgi:hypothetical protein